MSIYHTKIGSEGWTWTWLPSGVSSVSEYKLEVTERRTVNVHGRVGCDQVRDGDGSGDAVHDWLACFHQLVMRKVVCEEEECRCGRDECK